MLKIKHTHHDLILAWLDGKTIEWLESDDRWVELNRLSRGEDLPGFHSNYKYRIKEDPVYKPFSTIDQISRILGCKIKAKDSIGSITGAYIGVDVNNNDVLYIHTGEATEAVTADQFLKLFTFMNGTPCGILSEE